ncbi:MULTISPECIES: anaerobic ribonucleoside-triphosphate reductase activating protein [unclassified Clostridioides]|uniref:anaerobic ribonucleoside-triphosphate reductase activating protein n=1 Tax=unclassified Clostridioides TaxID=2635829 RepID=UPI001D11EE40|nr:anaerobic ribonucleoside-triphosphate reductase activating protein [Clostridioides sp. ES-S-0049-03]MCC0678232.1 anaerobic ribonucleoside-triphosphate reductase activating protein [Clostridioides sp. ES-W-0018-02]MCC0713026.1 anaerobic ribonucleoside-triphosphate reductase activating protein [Clostridioides sp. ES-W-0017-02]
MVKDYIYILDIKHDTIVDGEGFRTSIYCAGCNHKCNDCHNPQSWDMKNGALTKVSDIYKEIISNKFSDVTFSGGDPFLQPQGFIQLAKLIKKNTRKTIWCYTGFKFEELLIHKEKLELLKLIDVLVDGKFEKDKKELDLIFKGSSNQRIIDIKKSLKENQIVLYE